LIIIAVIGFLHTSIPLASMRTTYLYIASLITIGSVIWTWQRTSSWKIASASGGSFALLSGSFDMLQSIESKIPEHALAMLMIGFGSFVVGAVVSAFKGGLGHKLVDAVHEERKRFLDEWIESGGVNWYQRTVAHEAPPFVENHHEPTDSPTEDS
jgi:hypothetical protein